MRTIKDVIISGAIGPVWDHVVSLSKSRLPAKGGDCGKPSSIDIFEISPPVKMSFKSVELGFPILTTLELSRKGKRTSLRVIVTGWEAVGSERARAEMPKVSLEWEKTLALIKTNVELSSK